MEEQELIEHEQGIRDYIGILLRRRWVVAGAFTAALCVGIAYSIVTPSTYQTSMRMVVQASKPGFDVSKLQPLAGAFDLQDARDLPTQLEILRSSDFLAALKTSAGVKDNVGLTATQVGDTDAIDVLITSQSASATKSVVNAVEAAYSERVKSDRSDALKAAAKYVKGEFGKANEQLAKSELDLRNFRKKLHVTMLPKEHEVGIDQVAAADKSVADLKEDIAGTTAELEATKQARAKVPANIETPVTVSNVTEFALLRDRLSQLEQDRSAALVNMKATNPKVQELDVQIAAIKKRIEKTPQDIITITKQPNSTVLLTFDAKIADLEGRLAARKVQMTQATMVAAAARAELQRVGQLEITEAPLARAVDRDRENLAFLAKTLSDLELRQNAAGNNVKLLGIADDPRKVAPRPVATTLLAAVVGLILGLSLAFVQEYFDDRVSAGDDLRRVLGAPTLAAVPLINSPENRLIHGRKRDSTLMETFRMLRTGVKFATVDARNTAILVTSAFPGEGKSLVATNLATSLALNGLRVIVVDADLRRPSLHDKFDLNRQPGLTNVLIGHTPLEEALQDVGVPGLKILASGPLPPNPAELLGSHAMKELQRELLEHADLVIYDSPPLLAVSDAQVLAADVAGVVLVSVLGTSRRSGLAFVAELLAQVNARILGVVINKVKVDKGKRSGGYGYRYGYGYGRYGYGGYGRGGYGSYGYGGYGGYGYGSGGYGYGYGGYGYGSDYSTEEDKLDKGFREEFEALPHAREAGDGTKPAHTDGNAETTTTTETVNGEETRDA